MISPLPPEKSGEAPYTYRLIRSLVDTGLVEAIAFAGPEAEPIKLPGSKVETLPVWRGRSLLYPFHLLRQIARKRCHIVHVQFGPYGRVYGGLFGEVMIALLLLLRLVGIRTTMTLHSTWMPWQVVERIKQYRLFNRLSFLAAPFFHLYMRLLKRGLDSIQLSTAKEDSLLRRAFLDEYGFNPQRVYEIPHPCASLEERKNQQSAARSIQMDGRRIILLFGFVRAGKGYETALKAIASLKEKFPDIVLLIAGRPQGFRGDEYLEDLHTLAEHLDLSSNIRFDTRFIQDSEVPVYFAASTLLLIPYTESMGASGPIHNYAGYGVPIVASDAGFHNTESLGGNLFLFKAGDSGALAEKLADVLDNPDAMSEVSRRQIEYAKRENWSLAAKRTIKHYQKTLGRL